MTTIAETVIDFFTPSYKSFCQLVWGRDLTLVWTEQTGLPWTRVHEHVIFWLSIAFLLSVILNIILGVKVKRVNKCV